MYGVMDGEKIEAMRQERGLSRRELAWEAGIAVETVARVERGHRVRRKTGWKVARVFGIHPREIGRPADQERRGMDEANLTPEEREVLRDFDAYTSGSLDVSREQVASQMHDLTPEGLERVGAVLQERVRASQERQRSYEEIIEKHWRLLKLLETLIDRLER